jgi:MFS family permease
MTNNFQVPPRIRAIQVGAVAMLLSIQIINFLDRTALSVANPLIRQDMGLSVAEMGLLLSAFLWAYAFGQLPSGVLVDLFGPRRVLAIGLTIWSVAQAAIGIVGTMVQFALARVILGLGETPTTTSALRVIREWHDTGRRGLPTGICCAAPAMIGPMIAPPLLTWLMLTFSWRWMFVILGVAGLALVPVWFGKYREVREFRLDADEQRYLAEGGDMGTPKSVTFADWFHLFGFRTTWGLLIGYGGLNYFTWIFLARLPGYLEIERHMSLTKTGIVASIPFIGGLIGVLLSGMVSEGLIARGVSPIKSCRLPIVVGLIGAGLCTIVAAETASDVVAVGAMCCALFFGQGATAICWSLTSLTAPPSCTASLGSLQNFGGYLGAAMAPIVTGFVVQATGSFIPALLAGAAVVIIAAMMYLVVIPNRPIALPDAEARELTA